MLYPTQPEPRGRLAAWWHAHVTAPLDSMYDRLDERLDDDQDQ